MTHRIRYILLITLSLLWIGSVNLHAEQAKIPPFRITQTNGDVFYAKDLPAGKPLIIIYFSPDCADCLDFMHSFFPKIHHFDNANIAMISYLPLQEVQRFAKRFNVKQYSNVVIGTEAPALFIRDYFHIVEIPFLALYDKEGNKICTYQGSIPLHTVMTLFRKLK
ncbi:TlpA family protein disulfide reductase [Microbacter margulisiae]|uniref:Thioredoxin-related protein n=1 Tax=Microbacter margulisiae TaxID=1350067 RepID=A0A7W5DR82_9PORP|nr:redoxin domain-containing protein [Microbacter margulisiae]MBB3187617.1 thioredoxin-related protein [Microbacter margulisiae]